ncbi:hypothetical protein GCM10010992_22230 [Cloacibacterium rupense]|uniref:WG containing repeat-containing protein n=1 Tax=Cloacibacterium rupense TaxID=517423 RepID=A0ABQ2NLY9_9FLAO|nr:WG repeat-containing protein [Cloacibacterium rupense]GGP05580.1 hypothetical protein GCM10010992_22230 [Cloacibacterium rupense]
MKKLVHLFFVLFSVFCFGQEKDLWYPFFKNNSNTMGFKDKNGKVMIKPKFFAPFSTGNFNNIYAVNEIDGDEYYLLKNGNKVGKDSVYVFDTEYAKESEGKIKFRDKKTDKVGFFDKNGKVIIPAIYNDAGDFHNNIALVIKDAHKQKWESKSKSENHEGDCNHWSWKGGKTLAINTSGSILFEIPLDNYSHSIDYKNVYKKNALNENVDSDIYTTYKGSDGNTYSFYSPEKDFKKWFETKFLTDFKSKGKISENYFDKMVELQREGKPKHISRKIFLNKYGENCNNLIKEYLQNELEINFSDGNTFEEENKELSIELRLTPKVEKDFYQKLIIFTKIGDSFYITSTP